MLKALTDDISHRPCCGGPGRQPRREQLDDILDRPIGGTGLLKGREGRRVPVRAHDLTATQYAALACAKRIPARMAGVAMSEPLYQISAPIPFIALSGVCPINTLRKVKRAPGI